MEKTKILMVSAEAEPFAKTGGLGDVVGSLPKALNSINMVCRVIMPLYGQIANEYKEKMKNIGYIYVDLGWRHQYCGVFSLSYQGVLFYFIDNEYYYNREKIYDELELEKFAFLSKAAFEVAKYVNYKPNILHIHDWHTGAMAALLNDVYCHDEFFNNCKCVYTIHNLAYQGIFDKKRVFDLLPLNQAKYENTSTINFMALGIIYAHKVNTVSPTYAKEILTDQYGEGLNYLLQHEKNKLSGILNGIDKRIYHSLNDPFIVHPFELSDFENGKRLNKQSLFQEVGFNESEINKPLISIISRLASQKGMDLVLKIMNDLLNLDVKVVLLGSGDMQMETAFKDFANRYPEKFKAYLKFDNVLAHKIYAASDLFLMPSAFEPCGLAQMICLQYATLPLVRSCGGLKDSIEPFNEYTLQGNGFSFDNYSAHDFFQTILYALSVYSRKELWNTLIKNGFYYDFSWKQSAYQYKELYEDIK